MPSAAQQQPQALTGGGVQLGQMLVVEVLVAGAQRKAVRLNARTSLAGSLPVRRVYR
jgi:hypothetical protein